MLQALGALLFVAGFSSSLRVLSETTKCWQADVSAVGGAVGPETRHAGPATFIPAPYT